jgi:LCP family protein required for cell wall assembly
VVLFLMIAAVAGIFVFDWARQVGASGIFPPFTIGEDKPGDEVLEEVDPLGVYEGTDRVNILVMGIDQREHEDGPWRTDTMLVLTIDPVTMSGGMLSIPRDLWVSIPGYGMDRINDAHFFAEIDDYPGGGPALAVRTVEYNLGIPGGIHHYVRVNFTAFEKVIDLIGGIDVDVEEEIDDPIYPGERNDYDPLYIPAGPHHFDGEMALKYARTRCTGGGDFDRAKRQQQVVLAAFERVTQLDMLPTLALQAPELWRTLQDSVVTDPDLTLNKIIALANLASEVDRENIRLGAIDENYTQSYVTPDGRQVEIPLREQIRELRDYVFAAEAPALQEEDGPAARLEREAATIEVLNGTLTEGLASRTAEYLQQQGLQVVHTDNADRFDMLESLVIVYTGKTYTAEYIVRLLDLPATVVVHGSESDPAADYDISVILGADYQPTEQ